MTTTDHTPGIPRKEIRKLFRRHRGTASALARELGVGPNAISQWLRGRTVSAKIKDAAERMATRLMALEK